MAKKKNSKKTDNVKYIVKSEDGKWFFSCFIHGGYGWSDDETYALPIDESEADEIISNITTEKHIKVSA